MKAVGRSFLSKKEDTSQRFFCGKYACHSDPDLSGEESRNEQDDSVKLVITIAIWENDEEERGAVEPRHTFIFMA